MKDEARAAAPHAMSKGKGRRRRKRFLIPSPSCIAAATKDERGKKSSNKWWLRVLSVHGEEGVGGVFKPDIPEREKEVIIFPYSLPAPPNLLQCVGAHAHTAVVVRPNGRSLAEAPFALSPLSPPPTAVTYLILPRQRTHRFFPSFFLSPSPCLPQLPVGPLVDKASFCGESK